MISLSIQLPEPGVQTVFLDTCVMLDYLENRNEDVRDVVAQLILLHENGQIALVTSTFNMAELIDKEFEIHFIGALVSERFAYDEIAKERGNRKHFREVADRNRGRIRERITGFISKGILLLYPEFSTDMEAAEYDDLYRFIYELQLRSQDALIALTAVRNNVTYFLSNDAELVRVLNENGLIDAYSLRDPGQRQAFKDNVISSKVEVLG